MGISFLRGQNSPQHQSEKVRTSMPRGIVTAQRIAMLSMMMLALLAVKKTDAEMLATDPNYVPHQGLKCLVAAYPDQLQGAEGNTLIWKDGTRMQYDDGRFKVHEERLTDADLEDQMFQRYIPGPNYSPLPEDFDPGRARDEEFFRKMYGDSEAEAKANLVPVRWFGTTVKMTNINGVADQLQKVADELEVLCTTNPDLRPFLEASGGTFNWRLIAGTERASTHSFGIAIDINVANGNYWRWAEGDNPEPYVNRVPMEIAEVFEKHGFIWGGKWYHYDTMNFEYRPELLQEGCTATRDDLSEGPGGWR